MVREKGGVPASKIANDPAFQRTRENNAEFGKAGKASKILRTAFKASLQKASDSRMVSRLTQQMMKVIKADTTSNRGERNVINGELQLLEGFEFNIAGKLNTTLFTPFKATITRSSGAALISIPSFIPINMISAPAGTTHYRILMGAASVDFEACIYEQQDEQSDYLIFDTNSTTALNLQATLTAASTHPLFLGLGIEFLQQVNGNMYPLKNGAFNAFALVKVDV